MLKWLVIPIALFIWFFVFRKKSIQEDSTANDMVECVKCGMYVSQEEAILTGGKWYCSIACLKDKQ